MSDIDPGCGHDTRFADSGFDNSCMECELLELRAENERLQRELVIANDHADRAIVIATQCQDAIKSL